MKDELSICKIINFLIIIYEDRIITLFMTKFSHLIKHQNNHNFNNIGYNIKTFNNIVLFYLTVYTCFQ